MAAPAASTQTDVFKRPARKSRAGWILLVLLMSLAAFGMMYKDWVLQEAEAMKKYLLRGTPAAPAPEEAASAAAAAAAASAASAQALATAELAASVAAEATRVASAAEVAASTASAAASAAVLAPEPEKKEPEKKAADKPADEKDSDEAWVNQLPANGYVVQLAAMDTQDEMRSFQRSNAVYAKARIMRTRHKDSGKRFYILVAGPFETKAQADSFMQSSPLLAKGWLRSTKSMKTQFTKS
jgi:septal ring-binding cell division protein DamX